MYPVNRLVNKKMPDIDKVVPLPICVTLYPFQNVRFNLVDQTNSDYNEGPVN